MMFCFMFVLSWMFSFGCLLVVWGVLVCLFLVVLGVVVCLCLLLGVALLCFFLFCVR